VFQNGDNQETVQISETPGGPAGGPSGGSSSKPTDSGARPFGTYIESKKDSNQITIKSGGAIALDREGESVLQGVVFSTTDAAKGGKALRVDKVPPGSLLAQHGVQDGDVLVSVNGQAMSTKSEVVDYVKSHKSTYLFEVVIQRRGGLVHKTVQVER
jgi:S1-C subfamily serine protease